MNKSASKTAIMVLLIFMLCIVFMPSYKTSAEIADGVYSIDYDIIHSETESASIANDYFEKPAVLFVNDGEQFIRFTVNHSDWIKEIKTPYEDDYIDVEVKSEDEAEDMRDVVFKVEQADLNEPILFKMHVIVDAVDPAIDSQYTARFNLQMDSIEEIADSEYEEADLVFGSDEADDSSDAAVATDEAEKSSSMPSIILISVVIAIILIFVLRKVFLKK